MATSSRWIKSEPNATALAISGNMIAAIGDNSRIKRYKTNISRLVDMEGKTVIPGLANTRLHSIHGGQTYNFETYWYDKTKGEWIAVVGSWLGTI